MLLRYPMFAKPRHDMGMAQSVDSIIDKRILTANAQMQRVRRQALLLLLLVMAPVANGDAATAGYRLEKIDEGVSWVSSYWGYNAPKLVFDGESWFTPGSWGATQATSGGVIYRFDGTAWERGYEWDGLNYQPAMLLLDSAKRLILIHSRQGQKPVIMRAIAPGNFTDFEPLPVPDWMSPAGYLGAGIHDDVIALGYISNPATYSFHYAVFEMEAMRWRGPFQLASAQRQTEPFTTWLYPIMQPHENGIRMAVSNGRDSSNLKHEIFHLELPYELDGAVVPELVDVAIPWSGRICQAASMHRSVDGTTFITGQYHEEGGSNTLSVWRRRPDVENWERQRISASQIGAIHQHPATPEVLWLMSTFGSALALYRSEDMGDTWDAVELPSFAEHGLVSTFFLYGVNSSSGSEIPEKPTAVFSAGTHPNYQLWFVEFDVPTVPNDSNSTGWWSQ